MNLDVFTHRLNELYQPPVEEFSLVDVPEMKYMMIDGVGDPASGDFKAAVKWLFSLAHLIKPHIKEKLGNRFVEPPLECLFWSDRQGDFSRTEKSDWNWRVMIVVLDYVTEELFSEVVTQVEAKLGPAPSSLKLGFYLEGKSVQKMHVGDYSGVEKICGELYGNVLPSRQLKPNGFYHEIYLNDPSRVGPLKRKLVIRQPVS